MECEWELSMDTVNGVMHSPLQPCLCRKSHTHATLHGMLGFPFRSGPTVEECTGLGALRCGISHLQSLSLGAVSLECRAVRNPM